ncbi:VanZ family protein [Jeotgalibacillus proteolyticus]|uniref:VanZ-like domain-containing protein n=1 Tax=Jeotgalibacillus proteolyticus TaxID=2082395 RepID=A0A2S5GB91_9BACL|nr:VanZ family protein [Jeotgalibacillus proteolyticus]PPA70307.1 hypothetical protein C4B60_12065 [Jeotgalibacillus proteolyticus]
MRQKRKKREKNRKIKGALLRLIPFILFCGTVWYSSSQPYEDQTLIPFLESALSKEYFRHLLEGIQFTYGGTAVSIDALGYSGFIEFFIRKSAHLSIFFLIGLFLSSFLYYLLRRLRLSSLCTFLFIVMFASLDEYRQFLTGGRTPLVEDVVLDTIGGILAIGVYSLYRSFYKK